MSVATRLRELIAQPDLLVAPGAYDALSARLIAQAGFPAVYMTGFGTAASVLGQPDVGLLTMSETRSMCVARSASMSEQEWPPFTSRTSSGPRNAAIWRASRLFPLTRWSRKYAPPLMPGRTPTS